MCEAAIHNGADAIYVGMPHFNARGRTTDFSVSQLKEMIDLCHLYGVRVNLAFNVVIFEPELPEVIALLKEVLPLGPDALIVQDIGLAKLVRELAPEQVIHGSTQMTVTNHEAMQLLADLKIKRFVLGREVSLPEMKAIKEKSDCELEVFVHGALCVAYSGQCFTSESIGGRSANRGQCAQSCRLEYEMIVDGKKRDLGALKYLVSPKDLCGIAEIPELLKLGIESFKVEGRLKTPEYVAAAARHYREAIDHFGLKKEAEKKAREELGLTYSRGFFSGWLHGVDHQQLVDGTYGAHRGNLIGHVVKVTPKSVIVKITKSNLKKGDGILLAGSHNGKKTEVGGMLFDLKKISSDQSESTVEFFFAREFDLKKVQPDFKVFFNHDAQLEKKLSQSYQDKNQKKRLPISVKAIAKTGQPLSVMVSDGEHTVSVKSEDLVQTAHDRPVTAEDLKAELGALGASCFILHEFDLESEGDFFIHQKALKNLRRQFTEELMMKRVARAPVSFRPYELHTGVKNSAHGLTKLNILLREIEQVRDFLTFGDEVRDVINSVILDYEFGKGFAESVDLLRAANFKVAIATTRILKPNEYYNFKIIERANPDAILIRNLGALHYFNQLDKKFELLGDFSLNVTNSISAEYFLQKGLSSITASYDLNSSQLKQLISNSKADHFEVTIHQYMPSFHMEHCVFAAFMSKGSSFKDCGKPCEKHRLELKDQFGNHHQIKADQECRNTMFNATAQSAAKMIPEFKHLGVGLVRFEALYERGETLKKKITAYRQVVLSDNLQEIESIIAGIGVEEKYGLSDGSHKEREYKDRKKNN